MASPYYCPSDHLSIELTTGEEIGYVTTSDFALISRGEKAASPELADVTISKIKTAIIHSKKVDGGTYQIDVSKYNITNCKACTYTDPDNGKSATLILPILESNKMGDGYGWRDPHPVYGDCRLHAGIDLGAPFYSPVLAVADGTVSRVEIDSGGGGHYVDIKHTICGKTYVTRYMHMGPADYIGSDEKYHASLTNIHIVGTGQQVKAGQIIGSVGTSGGSTGPHLHFGIYRNSVTYSSLETGNSLDPKKLFNFSTTTKLYELNGSAPPDTPAEPEQKEIRVHQTPPQNDDFVPMFDESASTSYEYGSIQGQLIRRNALIGESSVELFDKQKINTRVCSGIGSTGINMSQPVSKKFDEGINVATGTPFSTAGKFNNAYCWACASNILGNKTKLDKLCTEHDKDWFEHNINNGGFSFGITPRKYAIACWKFRGTKEVTRVAIVTDVLGTSSIKVKEYPHNSSKGYDSKLVKEQELSNTNSNWGLDEEKYKFSGFIYLLNNSEIMSSSIKEDSTGIKISANTDYKYNTLTFGIGNIRHYNKIKIQYDVSVSGNADTSNVCIMASQQIVECKKPDSDWFKTGFEKKYSYEDAEKKSTKKFPFPFSAIQLKQLTVKDLVGKGTVSYDETFAINKCNFNGNVNFNTFNSDEYDVFNRELPLYISITPISSTDSSSTNSATVEVKIKKIILYR